MLIDFSKGKITLVIAPFDLRAGYTRLSDIAFRYLDIDVDTGGHWVVFVSRNRETAKIIGHDKAGSILITRKLDCGRFKRLISYATSKDTTTLNPELLWAYLDGQDIEVIRNAS